MDKPVLTLSMKKS